MVIMALPVPLHLTVTQDWLVWLVNRSVPMATMTPYVPFGVTVWQVLIVWLGNRCVQMVIMDLCVPLHLTVTLELVVATASVCIKQRMVKAVVFERLVNQDWLVWLVNRNVPMATMALYATFGVTVNPNFAINTGNV